MLAGIKFCAYYQDESDVKGKILQVFPILEVLCYLWREPLNQMSKKLIRWVEIPFCLIGLIVLSPLLLIVFFIGFFDTGAPLFFQTRVGKNKKPFKLIKFRTMSVDTESVATHLASKSSITSFGSFLRKTKLDEIPQLLNVLKGDMSLVGPRPNLFNQKELIAERTRLAVYDVLPGITGLAQIRNIDMSRPKLLAKTDNEMIESMTILKYFSYVFLTISGKGQGDCVR